ncbi:MAG: hypothetical protein AAGG07_08205 [Planctomycetota bacterium]
MSPSTDGSTIAEPIAIAAAASAVLCQCRELIESLDRDCYAKQSDRLKGGTIGKHVRHSVDHFAAALQGFDRGELVDYDRRSRDVPMETDRCEATAVIGELIARLDGMGEKELASSVRIRVMLDGSGTETELVSSLGRELWFATHHAIHHHAMIKSIVEEHGSCAPDDFGKAPSTINHERG